MPCPYLDDHPQGDVGFVSTRGANLSPPTIKTKSPIADTPKALFRLRRQGLEMVLVGDEPGLLAADNQQLLVLSLKQANTNGQVQTHAPELNLAGVCAVQGIDDENHEQEHVKGQQRYE